jgi:hypothetical protein
MKSITAPLTSKQKQDRRKAKLQAAAKRDGFETWSQALTAWGNGEVRMVFVTSKKGQTK